MARFHSHPCNYNYMLILFDFVKKTYNYNNILYLFYIAYGICIHTKEE